MADLNDMWWRGQKEQQDQQEGHDKAVELIEKAIDQVSSIHLAIELELGEEATERLIDGMWNDMRGMLDNPKQIDVLIQAFLELLGPYVVARTTELRHNYGLCGCSEEEDNSDGTEVDSIDSL